MSDDLRAILDALDEAHAAATPGPWTAATAPAEGDERSHADYLVESLRPDEGRPLWVTWAPAADVHEGDDVAYVVPVVTGDGPTSRENAAFVAFAHAAIPKLTAALRAVLGIHADWCPDCGDRYPCPTVGAIVDNVGVR